MAVQGEASEHAGRWIQTQGLGVQYDPDSRPILVDIDFTLDPGESVLLLGPSGCGKSTLAMACAGLLPGIVEAEVTGVCYRHPRLTRPGGVGYVFQDPDAQFCMLTLGDELAFGMENRHTARDEMIPGILQALQDAHLTFSGSPLEMHHATLSGGTKQKLAIACALAVQPDLLVLDEPTANLDPLATRQVFDEIAALHDRGQTLLVIEHKFDRLLACMDRVVLFDGSGRIYRQGPTMRVLRESWGWLIANGIVPAWKTPPWAVPGNMDTAQSSAGEHTDEAVTSAPAVCLNDVAAAPGGTTVWTGVDVEIPSGSFTAIVGPNGAGKTTLLQIMAGLASPSHGSVALFGQRLSRSVRKRLLSQVAYCFQNPELQFVFERVQDELSNQVVTGTVSPDVETLLNRFGLADLAAQSPYALSQGQKRRLSVATLLKGDRQLYCLDEPTFGQDAHTQQTIMEELSALHSRGRTVVMTTHDMDLVKQYATQVIVVAEGGVLSCGTAADLFADTTLMERAHLLSDQVGAHRAASSVTTVPVHARDSDEERAASPLDRLNPAWHLVSIVVTVLISVSAHGLAKGAEICLLPMVLMLALGWMSPLRLLKRYAAFALFYVFYLWTYMAYSRVPPGTSNVVHILWMHADWYGFRTGLALALRMLGAVGFGILFLSNTNLSVFASALSQSMRVPPRFSYGLFAGVHFMPLFDEEWRRLRQARRLRGREGSFWLRPALYALPILSQAIRMSERVAIAMEARGFVGEAAHRAAGRTYYRSVRFSLWDCAYDLMIPAILILIVWS